MGLLSKLFGKLSSKKQDSSELERVFSCRGPHTHAAVEVAFRFAEDANTTAQHEYAVLNDGATGRTRMALSAYGVYKACRA